ncbi:MAG: 4-alpha-glucanotransferase [Treponema sp.]|jgi:4-alpha-glucanotransferase|nr:4-alpha-glucanotransferase [Treponema sp.]
MAKQVDTPKAAGQTSGRLIGTVVPVGALRSEKSIGVGEFLDLAEFGALCAKMGVGLVQLLPVNDTGYESSPYSALTAFGLNPIYLRIGDLPEADGFEKDINAIRKEFNQMARFPYTAVLKAKMDLLKKIFSKNRAKIHSSDTLKTWIEKNPWVKPYAVFRRLKEANGEKSWKEWGGQTASWDDPALVDEHLFWAWLQQALDKQFSAAAASLAKAGIRLMGDLPILMNDDSCDVWAHRENFNLQLSAGAPPDMYSPLGQNWGFPTYNWEAQSKDGFTWWKARLAAAEKYYQAYRIDHVLGFFRIWASRCEEESALLGRYIPYIPLDSKDFEELKFDEGRIRWVCEPHIPTGEVWDAMRAAWGDGEEAAAASAAAMVFEEALDRIGDEELWLFKKSIRGGKDIEALDISPVVKAFLLKSWGNRIFFEHEPNQFFPVWYYKDSRAYASLSEGEKEALEALLEQRRLDSEKIWEAEGKRLLSVLTESSSMLPCAEDLGAVPACVPKVLTQLNILGLRVVRWHRDWSDEENPYIPFEDYPELSVCTPAVHDSSCLREWWDKEADQQAFTDFLGVPSLPKIYNPGTARIIINKIATAVSRFRVFQIQDLLHLSSRWYAADPASERINVPGTYNDFNWTYRLPAAISELAKDEDFIREVSALAAVKPAVKKKVKGNKGAGE